MITQTLRQAPCQNCASLPNNQDVFDPRKRREFRQELLIKAPLLIGLVSAVRDPPPRSEIIESGVALAALRPRGAGGHDTDLVAAALVEPEPAPAIAEPISH